MSKKRSSASRQISEEDRRLFLEAVSGIRPTDIVLDPNLVAQDEIEDSEETEELSTSFEQAMRFESRLSHEQMLARKWDGPPARERHRSVQKLKRPERFIDLHGKTVLEAHRLLDLFLMQCRRDDLQLVLVIHGKGSGILKEAVQAYLMQHELVSSCMKAPHNLGGGGAALVKLKKRRV